VRPDTITLITTLLAPNIYFNPSLLLPA
jgi:hypothetical protein